MELLTTSILTLLALYVIYSEPFKLPSIIKKNKKLSYGLIIGFYLYYCQNNDVEGLDLSDNPIIFIVEVFVLVFLFALVLALIISISVELGPPITEWLVENGLIY